MSSTVQGSATKGFRKIGNPSIPAAPAENSVPGGEAGGGTKGGENVHGSAGNGGAGDLKSGSGFPASGKGRSVGQL